VCFFLQVDVVLQRDTPKVRAAFELPDATPWVFAGKFPSWHLVQGGCSCGLVKSEGHAIDLDPSVLRALLADANVKRLHVIWYWTDEAEDPPEERLDIAEFEECNAEETLAQDTRYRINDASKYTMRRGRSHSSR